MKLASTSINNGQPIPDRYAFGTPNGPDHFQTSDNLSPQLAWTDVPEGTRSLVLICVDNDVPSKPDDVNQEGREVPSDLPRVPFYHWVMVDIPPSVLELAEGACSNGITPKGKPAPAGPEGTRQGRNDYTGWFAGDADMGGTYLGYDGPCPPWNDSIVHNYHFRLYATDLESCPVPGSDFAAAEVLEAIEGHVLAEAEIVGSYTMNPRLR